MVEEWGDRVQRTEANLLQHVHDVWEGVRRNPLVCHSFVASMNRRLQNFIDENGGYTKY